MCLLRQYLAQGANLLPGMPHRFRAVCVLRKQVATKPDVHMCPCTVEHTVAGQEPHEKTE